MLIWWLWRAVNKHHFERHLTKNSSSMFCRPCLFQNAHQSGLESYPPFLFSVAMNKTAVECKMTYLLLAQIILLFIMWMCVFVCVRAMRNVGGYDGWFTTTLACLSGLSNELKFVWSQCKNTKQSSAWWFKENNLETGDMIMVVAFHKITLLLCLKSPFVQTCVEYSSGRRENFI